MRGLDAMSAEICKLQIPILHHGNDVSVLPHYSLG
jgi:hypothetical protein